MAEVKPYAQEEIAEIRDTEKALKEAGREGMTGNARWLATLAAVEKELAEARENAERYNADMMKVREQRDELLAKVARLRRGFSDTLEAEYAHAVKVAEMFVSGRALALMQEAYDHACKGNDRMCAAVLLADAGPLLVHHATSTGSKTFHPTSGTHAEYVHGDEPRNPYRAKHDPIREDAWDEGYGEAHEHYCTALAASQATVKELREEFAAFVAAHPDTIDMSGRDDATDAELALLESHMRAAAALARTDDMGALEEFAKECVAAGRQEADHEQEAWSAGVPRAASSDEAIVARLMRRAGEGEK